MFAVSVGIRRLINARSAISSRTVLLLEVHTDDGSTGTGEAYLQDGLADVAGVAACFERLIWPALVQLGSLDPNDVSLALTGLCDLEKQGAREPERRRAFFAALSAVDVACWDLFGQAQGRPIWALLGEEEPESRWARPYASGLPYRDVPDQVAEDLAELARLRAAGFQVFKMRLGRSLDLDLKRVDALADALDDNGALAADANRALTLPMARELGEALGEVKALWLEEPFPPSADGWGGLRKLPVALAAGEAAVGSEEAKQLVGDGSVQVLQPDIGAIGGLTHAMVAARHAAQNGVYVTPHVWGSGVAVASALHFIAAKPPTAFIDGACDTPLVELDATGNPLVHGVLKESLVLSPARHPDGLVLCATESPGLGVALDHDFVSRHQVQSWSFVSDQ